ncbi:MAG: S41 family peptidase [Patescibacteria group bacterium]|nr:S41 family peptidase [Patescibacteria group bacterium]
MPSLFKKNLASLFLLVIIVASFGLGLYFGKSQCQFCPPEEIDFSLFWEAYHKLQEKFVDKEKLDIQKIIYGAIKGMVKSLEDPYTIFLPPEETKRFIEDVKGIFEGVGMEIGIKKGQLQVIAPLEGTPAQRAGLRAGDKIIKIDDKPTMDMTIEEAVNLIRGPRGTKVTLTIFREGWEETREFKITRAIIEIPSLKWEIKDSDIAYIKLYHFTEKASFDFRVAAFEILASPAKKIILDLRNNPGGYLEVAQDIAGWFLERGQIVAIEDSGQGKQKEYKAKEKGLLFSYPLVILINQGSASGAEILAGALRDNRGILLIGEKSFGKGSVQELEKLSEGSSLKITIARWLTPKGELITNKGLQPDIRVEITDEDFEQGRDPQLDKAIEVIKEMR